MTVKSNSQLKQKNQASRKTEKQIRSESEKGKGFDISQLESTLETAMTGYKCELDNTQFIEVFSLDPAMNGKLSVAIETSVNFENLSESTKRCANPHVTPLSPEGRFFQNHILGQGFIGEFKIVFEEKVYTTNFINEQGEIESIKGTAEELFTQSQRGRELLLNTFPAIVNHLKLQDTKRLIKRGKTEVLEKN